MKVKRELVKRSPPFHNIIAFIGLFLLFLAGLVNYSSPSFYAASWRVFIRLPGMIEGENLSFHIWWIIIGLPLLLFFFGLSFPVFRRALLSLWRHPRYYIPILGVLLFLLFSLFPWEYSWVRPSRSHIVLYHTLATGGFILLLIGIYNRLSFLDTIIPRIYNRLIAIDPRLFILITFAFMFTIANLISLFVFEHIPHISDSIAQLFQARIFASGRLYLPSAKFPDFFDYGHIINNGRWYSQYQFLHPFLLMLGVLLGTPWIINPLLGALTVMVIYLLGREVYLETTGRLAAILACFTPFLFNMSAEFMNHATSLFFTTLFLLFYFRTIRKRKWHYAFLAGAFLGLVANVRIYTAFLVGLPFAFYSIYWAVQEPRRFLFNFLIILFGFLLLTSLNLLYNWLTNGDPFLFGYIVRWGAGHSVGFGKSGWGMRHTPLRGLFNIGHDLNLLNKFLFELPIPSLLPLGLLFASGTRDKRDWLLLSLFLSLWAGHFFYWYHGIAFGARFLYEATPAFLLLAVRGAEKIGRLLRFTFQIDCSEEKVSKFLCRVCPILLLLMIIIGLPPLFRLYRTYWGVDGTLLRTVKKERLENALIFCPDLGDVFNANSLTLNGPVVYARDYGLLNSALTIAYPSRKYYYANYDTIVPLLGIEYASSQMKRNIEEMASFLSDSLLSGYRTLILPFKDIPLPGFDGVGPFTCAGAKRPIIKLTASNGTALTDFREVTVEVMTQRRKLDSYLPALALWLSYDQREHLMIFNYMNRSKYFVAGDYKFRRLYTTGDGAAAIYEILLAKE